MSPKEKLECEFERELEWMKNMPRHDTVSSGLLYSLIQLSILEQTFSRT
jgi:hypothetical protein